MKDTADADYVDTKRVCKGNEKKKNRRMSWLVYSKLYIIISRSIGEL